MPTARHYFEAVVASMIMLTLRVTSGFLGAAVTDNRIAVMVTMAVVILATGAIISLRVCLPSAAADKFGADQRATGILQQHDGLER